MLDRQQRDELVASLQSVKELWTGAADINVIQSNIIMEILRVADDVCRKGLSATRYVFYQELFQVLVGIVEPQVWQNLSQAERQESERLGMGVLNCCIEALVSEKEIKREIVFLPYKASMWDSLESVWQAAYGDKMHCNTYVVPIPYADKKSDGTVAEWHCEADLFPDYVPVLDWHEYTLEKLKVMQPNVIFIHNPYDNVNAVTFVEPQYFSPRLKECTQKLVYIPYYICGDVTLPARCRVPGVYFSDYVVVQNENIKEQFEANYPVGKVPEGKFLALGSPKFDKVLTSKKEDFYLPKEWQRIIQGKKVVLYNTSINTALSNSDMVCKKLRYVLDVFKGRNDVALWWRPHPLMEATFRSIRPGFYAEYEQIVAEYKQAGWGIYDDTPDVNMAITYSDCYYGDYSSVLWTYRETGKPIMVEDMHIQSERKQLFDVQYVCYEAGCLWFLTNEKNIVSLFKFDIDKNKLSYIFSFKDKKSYSTYSYVCLAKSGNKIIMAPFQSNGDFIEYDIRTKEYKKKPLPPNFLKLGRNQEFEGFAEVVTYGNSIYFISYTRMAMVEYVKNTGKYTCKKIMIDEKYLKLSEWDFCMHGTVLLGDKLFIAVAARNKIVEYSFYSGKAVVHPVPFKAELACICYIDKKFYINQYNSFDIVVFDLTNYMWNKMVTVDDEISGCPFNGGILTPKGILYLPCFADFKMLLGREGVLSVEHIERMKAEMSDIQYLFVATNIVDGKAFAIRYWDSKLEVYNTVNGNKSEYILECLDERLIENIFALIYKDEVIVKENMIAMLSLQSFIKYISKNNKIPGCSVNGKTLVGHRIYEILGGCNV